MKLTLEQIRKHPDKLFHELRWSHSHVCPHCGSSFIDTTKGKCYSCKRVFSDTTKTIFHATKLSTLKILQGLYYFLESPRGISSYTLAKFISISQPTAWRFLHILRSHLHEDLQASGEVILDEVYLGCDWKFKPQHKKLQAIKKLEIRKRQENPKWTAPLNQATFKRLNYQAASEDKMLVFGIRDYKAKKLQLILLSHFNQDLLLNLLKTRDNGINHYTTDESTIYKILPNHSTCNHSIHQYKSDDGYSSNPIENHFTHLRRKWRGIHTWWSEKYCQYYLNEFSFKYNYRELNSFDRIKQLFCLIITNMG
jgi:transposase-like protein